MTVKTVKNLTDDTVISTETFAYDAAGNIIGGSAETAFSYDTNNRLTSYDGHAIGYDADGNMTETYIGGAEHTFEYDSANRLISAGGHTYTYNAEDVRIRNLCADEDTTYTYNTNCKLSQLLVKTTNGTVTKYVYGRGLIGEETAGVFKTYHFDFRGSTVAVTDQNGNITDTFAYDTYGKLIDRTGTSEVIFGYNGRDGVVTDDNGLIYMRARYYSPELRRFINSDVIAGEITNAITLNRYAYANGNPVSNTDPFGLSVERGEIENNNWTVNKIIDGLVNLGYILNLYERLSLISALYEIATNLSAVDLLAQWMFGDGSDQYFDDDSSLADAFKNSDYMNSIIEDHINEYKATGKTEFHGNPRITGFDEFDLWMGVRGFNYNVTISERTYTQGILWWKQEKTEYVVDVTVNDTYNFNKNTDSGDGLGSILNNLAFDLHEKGIGRDYSWELNYQVVIR